MKATQSQLQQISQEALDGSTHGVRVWLGLGVNYREAILYLSGFHNSREAEKLILQEATCKCGQIAIHWKPEPICANCSFHISMKQIEYK